MKILLIEPYYTGSHKSWAEGYRTSSGHDVDILELGGNFWKWRMHGGAVTLARRFMDSSFAPDVILASDMLDLTTFLSLTRERTAKVPAAVYFHENQLSYPWSPSDRDVQHNRDKHYAFVNYASAMAADAVFFNSSYHLESFFDELGRFLKHFPDHNEVSSVKILRAKSSVLPLGMDLLRFDQYARENPATESPPLLLWNHRWEYDKNPEEFFHALYALAARGVDFSVAILGENFQQAPAVFLDAREKLGDRVVQFGYAGDFSAYAGWLHRADVLPVTSHQDFFGASVVEAVYCGCRPLLPRRLTYPELIPADCHGGVFYDDFDQLVARLEACIKEPIPISLDDIRAHVAQYDWNVVTAIYDKTLEELAASKKEGGFV